MTAFGHPLDIDQLINVVRKIHSGSALGDVRAGLIHDGHAYLMTGEGEIWRFGTIVERQPIIELISMNRFDPRR